MEPTAAAVVLSARRATRAAPHEVADGREAEQKAEEQEEEEEDVARMRVADELADPVDDRTSGLKQRAMHEMEREIDTAMDIIWRAIDTTWGTDRSKCFAQ